MEDVPSFQAEKEKQKASRDLLKSFHMPLGVATSGSKDSEKKKGKLKGKDQAESMTAPGEEKERTTIEKKFNKHAGTKKQQKYWDNRKRYVD